MVGIVKIVEKENHGHKVKIMAEELGGKCSQITCCYNLMLDVCFMGHTSNLFKDVQA